MITDEMNTSSNAETFEELVELLMSGEEWSGRTAAEKLIQFDLDLTIPILFHALRHSNHRVQSNGAYGLSLIGDKAIKPLIEIIKDNNAVPSSRHVATGVLGGLGKAAVLPAIELLSDEHELVRKMATASLGNLGDLRALIPLINALQTDPSAEVREWAAYSLASLNDSRALEPLIAALKDHNRGVRFRVIGALGRLAHSGLKDTRPVVPLMEIVKQVGENDLDIMTSAISALGDFGDNRSFELLMNLVQNENNHDRVRENAIVSLGHLKNDQAVEVLVELLSESKFRLDAAIALGEIGDHRAIKPLMNYAMDTNVDVCYAVILALGIIGDETAVPLLSHIEQTDTREDGDGDKISLVASRAINLINQRLSNK